MPIGGTAFLGQNQSPRLTTQYLNQSSRKGDPAPGVNVSTAQVSGSIVQPYDGFAGGKLTITGPWAAQFSDPEVGPIYGGVYQYVQFNPADTAPPIPGQFVWWLDETNYIVTSTYAAATAYKVAGVAINPDTPGNWDFVQIAGIASVVFGGAAALGAAVSAQLATPSYAVVGPGAAVGVVVMQAGVLNTMSPAEINIAAGWNY